MNLHHCQILVFFKQLIYNFKFHRKNLIKYPFKQILIHLKKSDLSKWCSCTSIHTFKQYFCSCAWCGHITIVSLSYAQKFSLASSYAILSNTISREICNKEPMFRNTQSIFCPSVLKPRRRTERLLNTSTKSSSDVMSFPKS